MFKCEICDKEFDAQKQLTGHKMTCRSKPEVKEKLEKMNTTSLGLTSEDQAIVERVTKQDTDWFHIREDELTDFSLMNDPLELPLVAKNLRKREKYAFRWCERTAKRVDQLTKSVQPPLRWAIVNRVNLPELKDQVDDILGCVIRLDQVLLFKPYSHFRMVQAAKEDLAKAQDASGGVEAARHKSRDGMHFKASRRKTEGDEASRLEISSSDEIMGGDEIDSMVDSQMGVTGDSTDLGDLVVNE